MSESKLSYKQKDNLKKALITGANRGLGFGFVRQYLESGYLVLATSRNKDSQDAIFHLVKEYQDQLLVEALDVTSVVSIKEFEQKLKHHNIIFDIVINNAGVSIEEDFGTWTPEVFETNIRVNTIGPALVAQAVTPFMTNGSRLIQISSGMGSLELNINPQGALDAYAVSKAGLNILTRRLAAKFYNDGIIVVSINPGWVQTDMGGPEAPATVPDVIHKMMNTIDKLSLTTSGTFLSDDGEVLPW